MPDYQFEVFISYKNHDVTNPWVVQLEKQLKFWLTQDLGGEEPRIFFGGDRNDGDKKSIGVGRDFKTELINGLKYSKCMLCIWTPQYFKSKWCLTEWRSFQERQKKTKPLVIPIRFCDGMHYPADARDIEMLNFEEYAIPIPSIWEKEELIRLVKKLSKILAEAISAAPDHEDDFPIIEIIDPPPPPPPNTDRLKL